jgi:uncharacterized cupredoxin-like copper-binding protein
MNPERAMQRCRVSSFAILTLILGVSASCSSRADSSATRGYRPQTRQIAITTVPLLVKEQAKVLPFLAEDFAKGGVLDGKEVYAFSPSTISVVEGDTIRFSLINPEDDVHSFVLPDFVVPLPPMKRVDTTYVARHAGIFPFVCAVTGHLPMMSGQLIVLAPSSVSGSIRP